MQMQVFAGGRTPATSIDEMRRGRGRQRLTVLYGCFMRDRGRSPGVPAGPRAAAPAASPRPRLCPASGPAYWPWPLRAVSTARLSHFGPTGESAPHPVAGLQCVSGACRADPIIMKAGQVWDDEEQHRGTADQPHDSASMPWCNKSPIMLQASSSSGCCDAAVRDSQLQSKTV